MDQEKNKCLRGPAFISSVCVHMGGGCVYMWVKWYHCKQWLCSLRKTTCANKLVPGILEHYRMPVEHGAYPSPHWTLVHILPVLLIGCLFPALHTFLLLTCFAGSNQGPAFCFPLWSGRYLQAKMLTKKVLTSSCRYRMGLCYMDEWKFNGHTGEEDFFRGRINRLSFPLSSCETLPDV